MTDRIGGFGKKLGDTRTDSEKTPAKPTPRATQLSDQAKKRHTRVPSLGWQKGAPSGEQGEVKPETPRFLERDRRTVESQGSSNEGGSEDLPEVHDVELVSFETVQIVQSEAKPAPPALPPRPAIPRLKMPTNEEPQSTGVELPSVDVVPEIKTARPSTDRYLMRELPRLGHKRTGSDQQGEKEKVAKKSKAKLIHKRFVTDLSSLGDGTPRTPRQTPGEKAAAPVPKKPKPLPTRPDMSVNTPRKPWPTTPSTPRAEARAKPQDSARPPREDVDYDDLPPLASPVDRDDTVISPRSNKES